MSLACPHERRAPASLRQRYLAATRCLWLATAAYDHQQTAETLTRLKQARAAYWAAYQDYSAGVAA